MKGKINLPGGKRLSYRVYGDKGGYPILSFHGLAGSVDVDGMDEQLTGTGLKWICAARPGYGESDFFLMENIAGWVELLRPLLKRLDVDDFDVVGISAGAAYAYAVAAAFPNKVKNVFICKGIAAIYKPEVLTLYPDKAASEIAIYQNGSLEEIAENLRKNYLAHLTDEQKAIPHIRDSMVGGCMGMAACGKLEFMTDWGFDIEKVMQPVYLYHCRDDSEVPFAMAEKTKEYLPNAAMFTRDTGGHLAPELMADMMKAIKKLHCDK